MDLGDRQASVLLEVAHADKLFLGFPSLSLHFCTLF